MSEKLVNKRSQSSNLYPKSLKKLTWWQHWLIDTLINICWVCRIDWFEARSARVWHQRLRLGRDRPAMHLGWREERLYIILFDHGTAMDRHANDAWNGILFLNAHIKSAVPT